MGGDAGDTATLMISTPALSEQPEPMAATNVKSPAHKILFTFLSSHFYCIEFIGKALTAVKISRLRPPGAMSENQ
jgi:hypothetical protein